MEQGFISWIQWNLQSILVDEYTDVLIKICIENIENINIL